MNAQDRKAFQAWERLNSVIKLAEHDYWYKNLPMDKRETLRKFCCRITATKEAVLAQPDGAFALTACGSLCPILNSEALCAYCAGYEDAIKSLLKSENLAIPPHLITTVIKP